MTQPGTPQLSALTSLRGVAAWMVVAYHFRETIVRFVPTPVFATVAHGALAVDLFFVMSGFIIALNYGWEFRRDGIRTYGRFLLLRLARIYPLHIFMLGLFVLYASALSVAHGRDEFHEVDYLVRSVFLVQAWLPGIELAWNTPAWSISTEMFAYLLFPAMVWLASRFPGRGAAAAWLVAALVVLAVGAAPFGSLGGNISRFGLARCLLEFFAGVMVHRLWERGGRTPGSGLAALALAVGLVACLPVLGAPDYLVMPGAFCCLIYGLAVPGTWPTRLLAWPPLIWLGTISYATYLSHALIRDWVKFVLERPGVPLWAPFPTYIVLVLAASWLLYELVEVPGRHLLRRVADRVTAAPRVPASRG